MKFKKFNSCFKGGSIGLSSNKRLIITPVISTYLLEQQKYISKLSIFNKWIIWRYTMGSGGLGMYLLKIPNNEERIIFWCNDLFKYFNYKQYKKNLPKKWKKYDSFFKNKDFLKHKNKQKLSIEIVKLYAEDLQNIIKKSPKTKHDITLYKASSKYPDLENAINELEKNKKKTTLEQKSFSSSTWSIQFNFGLFLTTEGLNELCCFHIMKVPKGSKILYLPTEIHAYGMLEREILIPANTIYTYEKIGESCLSYIDKDNYKFMTIQNEKNLVIGNVYDIDPENTNFIQEKPIKVVYATIKTI